MIGGTDDKNRILITNKFLEIDSTTLAGYDFSGMNLHRATLNGYCLDGAKFEKLI